MLLALLVSGLVVALVVIGLFVFALRRRLIQRSGGTFDCSLRWGVAEELDISGKGWVYGVARYSGDRIDWFRVFSYSPGRAGCWSGPPSRSSPGAPPRARRSWPCCPTPSCSAVATRGPAWNWR